jgi:hypothetical protein
VKRRPTGTDRSVAQSTYVLPQQSEPQAPVLLPERSSAIYIGPEKNSLAAVKEDEMDETEEDESVEIPLTSPLPPDMLLESSLSHSSSNLPNLPNPSNTEEIEGQTFSTASGAADSFASGPPNQNQSQIEVENMGVRTTPEAFIPPLRFSSHFATKFYLDQPSKEPPPPVPSLPTLTPVEVKTRTMPAAVISEQKEATEINGRYDESEPTTPRAATQTTKSVEPSSSPAETVSTIPSVGVESKFSTEPEPEPEPIAPGPEPASILAPIPIPLIPNRVRFASNPVEIHSPAWDRTFGEGESEEEEEDSSSLRVDSPDSSTSGRPGNAKDPVHLPISLEPSRSKSSPRSILSAANTQADAQWSVEHPVSKPSGGDILDLLNAATDNASSILAMMKSDSPSPSPSIADPSPRVPTSSPSASLFNPPRTLGENSLPSLSTASPSFSFSSSSPSASNFSVPSPSSLLSPASSMTNGRKASTMMKKSLPSSPYPQRRLPSPLPPSQSTYGLGTATTNNTDLESNDESLKTEAGVVSEPGKSEQLKQRQRRPTVDQIYMNERSAPTLSRSSSTNATVKPSTMRIQESSPSSAKSIPSPAF